MTNELARNARLSDVELLEEVKRLTGEERQATTGRAAYLRIEAARAARKWPAILRLLTEGALHLTAISLLAPHLTVSNHDSVHSRRNAGLECGKKTWYGRRGRPSIDHTVFRSPGNAVISRSR